MKETLYVNNRDHIWAPLIKADPRIDLKCSLTVLILQKLNTWRKQLFLFEYYYVQTCITYAADFFFSLDFQALVSSN